MRKIGYKSKVCQEDENGFTISDIIELDNAILDHKQGENIEGPFDTVEAFINSLKKK